MKTLRLRALTGSALMLPGLRLRRAKMSTTLPAQGPQALTNVGAEISSTISARTQTLQGCN
jgi:hypothetical protein